MRPVPTLDEKLADWTRTRRRLELETRLLVVDDEQAVRRQIDDLLYRLRVSSRSVTGTEQAMELLAGGSYPLLLVAESLSGMGGLYLIRQIRQAHPGVDAMLTSWEPTVDLLARAFDLRLLDVVRKPLPERQVFGEQIRAAIRRNVDRRMRRFLVQELHASLEELPEAVRVATTHQLEERLTDFKASLGSFNRVLVVESDDADLRLFGESLLVLGLHVESSISLQDAVARARAGELHLIIARCSGAEDEMRGTLVELRGANPLAEVMLVSRTPDVELARTALLLEAAGYFAWPPASLPALAGRVPTLLRRARRERLLDNLVVELFRETSRAFGGTQRTDGFPHFCKLVGLSRVTAESSPLVRAQTGEAVEYLDDVLDTLLAPEEQPPDTEIVDEPAEIADAASANRRIHQRVPESQFVRFRAVAWPASTLAMVGDLSEGGLFIRTTGLLASGTELELEFQVVHETQGYLICCRAQVAWVAREASHSPHGMGFGVKFLDAPPEVVVLLQQIVLARTAETEEASV
jgi:DNA-binding response OmpR family regulator